MDKVSALLEQDPCIESVTAITGYSILTGSAQSNGGTMFVVLNPWKEREGRENRVFAIAQKINRAAFQVVPEAQVFAITPPAVPGMGAVGGLEFVLQDSPVVRQRNWPVPSITLWWRPTRPAAVMAFGLAIIFIYRFLVAQYESWSIPLAIILVVPMALVGAIAGLMLVGMELNLYGQIGLVLSIGMAAKNAILIVEFARTRRERDGEPIIAAAREAARLRFVRCV